MMKKRHIKIEEIQNALQKITTDREWDQYHSPRNLAMALSVEVGELLELFLWCSDNGPQPPVDSRKDSVREEVADVFICLLNLCRKMNIDLYKVTQDKILDLEKKYPIEKSKGKLEKHNEL
jgi:NTP pyrophosphatase (non-canonical NTP hydrolase)